MENIVGFCRIRTCISQFLKQSLFSDSIHWYYLSYISSSFLVESFVDMKCLTNKNKYSYMFGGTALHVTCELLFNQHGASDFTKACCDFVSN